MSSSRWLNLISTLPITAQHAISHSINSLHDDVIKWKHFPRYWPFVRGIHRSPVNSPHKGQWRGALMFTLICARINGWVNNREAGDLRRYRAHYDVIVMEKWVLVPDKVQKRMFFSSIPKVFILFLWNYFWCYLHHQGHPLLWDI